MKQVHPNYNLTKSRKEGTVDETFSNPLPRAVIRPNAYILLDGEWNFAVDKEDAGLREGWHLWHQYQQTAHWPGSIEEQLNQQRQGEPDSPAWQDKVVVWYEREFALPDRSEVPPQNMLQLTFGACGYETRVWLNGQPLTTIEGEEVHMGEYTSFSYELDEESLRRLNRLTVRIADTMDADIPRGKQESHVYKRGGIWYQTYTGAVRSVWLETVERNRLRSRMGVVSIVEDNLVRFNVMTRIHDAGNYILRLKVFDRKQDTARAYWPLPTFRCDWKPGRNSSAWCWKCPDARSGRREAPHLYRLVAQLMDAEGYIAAIETHFGLRKIEARGRYMYLNNKPIYLDGILYQPGTATYEEIEAHMHAMKELGCNLVRIHIAGIDPRIYNLADKLGLLLWVEVPSPHSSTARSRENHRAELLRMLALIETHPSVVIWSLYNEDWGAQDIATNPETRQYIVDMYHYMQLAYPQFLVVDNDGWQHISYEGRLKSDLLTAHLYTPDLARWQELLDRLVDGRTGWRGRFPAGGGRSVFLPPPGAADCQRMGRFWLCQLRRPPGCRRTAPNRSELFKQELRKRPIAGDVYTQATNIEDEKNGIIDAGTGELKVPAGILASKPVQKNSDGLVNA